MITITIKKGKKVVSQVEVSKDEKQEYEQRAKLDLENLNRWHGEGHTMEVVDPEQQEPESEPTEDEDKVST
jgi:hypothetical protein